MIHTLLRLTRPLINADTETTSLNPQEARIVEIGFEIWNAEGLIRSWRSLINPEIDIPKDATEIHHITDEMVRACRSCGRSYLAHTQPPVGTIGDPTRECEGFKPWPTFKQLASNLSKGFTNVDWMGKNIRFDLRVLAAEFERAGVPWSYSGARIIDADRLEQLGEPRTLSHLYKKHTGKDLDGAHGALADVVAAREVIEIQFQKYENLPRDLDKIHKLQFPGWLDDNGSFKMINGVATCQFGKHRGKAMRDIPKDYYDWLANKSDFSADVKALARDAKVGKFPQRQEEPGEM